MILWPTQLEMFCLCLGGGSEKLNSCRRGKKKDCDVEQQFFKVYVAQKRSRVLAATVTSGNLHIIYFIGFNEAAVVSVCR